MDGRSLIRLLLGVPILGALGVVFGDTGTSPIYTRQTVFNPGGNRSRCPRPPSTGSLADHLVGGGDRDRHLMGSSVPL
jgi:hypothetical protein